MTTKFAKAALLVVASFSVSGVVTAVTPTNTDAAARVWIAPRHGKKYHYQRGCRGLYRAGKHVKHVSLKYAKSHGYKRCKVKNDTYSRY